MKILVSTFFLAFFAGATLADIPHPYRSLSANLGAEKLVVCSDYPELNATKLSSFLALQQIPSSVIIVDGPRSMNKPLIFGVLVSVSGKSPKSETKACGKNTVPYHGLFDAELADALEPLGNPVKHPVPAIESTLGKAGWVQHNYYHPEHNWVTIIIGLNEGSPILLNRTMKTIFGLQGTSCTDNPVCFRQD